MSAMASEITSLTIVYSTTYSRRRSKKTSKLRVTGLVRRIHWWLVNSPHKGPVTRKMFPIDDVIMLMIPNKILSAVGLKHLSNLNVFNFVLMCKEKLSPSITLTSIGNHKEKQNKASVGVKWTNFNVNINMSELIVDVFKDGHSQNSRSRSHLRKSNNAML